MSTTFSTPPADGHQVRLHFNLEEPGRRSQPGFVVSALLNMDDSDPVRIPVTDVLDLHSIHPRDVRPVVKEYLLEARRLGFRALRIIHGRGIGVQRETVRGILDRTEFIASYSDAPLEVGGWGATIVTLKV